MKKILLIGGILLILLLLFREKGSGPIVSQNGIATTQFAGDLMSKYDRNADGLLDVADESFLESVTGNIRKVESRGLLFSDADAEGDGNGSVTAFELVDFLDQFDTDGDGELTTYKNVIHSIFSGKSEWATFDDRYGERYKYEEIDLSE